MEQRENHSKVYTYIWHPEELGRARGEWRDLVAMSWRSELLGRMVGESRGPTFLFSSPPLHSRALCDSPITLWWGPRALGCSRHTLRPAPETAVCFRWGRLEAAFLCLLVSPGLYFHVGLGSSFCLATVCNGIQYLKKDHGAHQVGRVGEP